MTEGGHSMELGHDYILFLDQGADEWVSSLGTGHM